MSELLDIAAKLSARLPELERRLVKLGAGFNSRLLPKGVFRASQTIEACIADIEQDIATIRQDQQPQLNLYIVSRIEQKIAILVQICRLHQPQAAALSMTMMDKLSTRAQWLASRDEARAKILAQKEALMVTLKMMEGRQNVHATLALQAELGDIERQLSLL